MYKFYFVFFIISGCVYSDCSIVGIDKDDSSWLEPFLKYEKLIFETGNGEEKIFNNFSVDTSLSPCNKFELGPNQYESIWAYGVTDKPHKTREGEKNKISLSISTKFLEGNRAKKTLRILDFTTSFYEIDSILEIHSIFCPALNKEIDTYFLTISKVPYPFNDTVDKIWTLNYSKEYGLIQFTMKGKSFLLKSIEYK